MLFRSETTSGFFLLSSPKKAKLPKVALFRNWLMNALKDMR